MLVIWKMQLLHKDILEWFESDDKFYHFRCGELDFTVVRLDENTIGFRRPSKFLAENMERVDRINEDTLESESDPRRNVGVIHEIIANYCVKEQIQEIEDWIRSYHDNMMILREENSSKN